MHVKDEIAASEFDDVPAGQPTQPLCKANWPAGQITVHVAEPTAEKCPPLQLSQTSEPVAAEYMLLEQLVQLIADAAEYDPGAQAPLTDASPTEPQ